jgi:ABC-type dipeptide/oligopeptide/nickel transport system ATPase component
VIGASGIPAAERRARGYPHEMSGACFDLHSGDCQRVMQWSQSSGCN